jgi:hypothetical protein
MKYMGEGWVGIRSDKLFSTFCTFQQNFDNSTMLIEFHIPLNLSKDLCWYLFLSYSFNFSEFKYARDSNSYPHPPLPHIFHIKPQLKKKLYQGHLSDQFRWNLHSNANWFEVLKFVVQWKNGSKVSSLVCRAIVNI